MPVVRSRVIIRNATEILLSSHVGVNGRKSTPFFDSECSAFVQTRSFFCSEICCSWGSFYVQITKLDLRKHMDKHTRPYVCNLPGCEKIRGFTYSGGLSRHQREVHRQYGGPKASYMCPHKDCKRSTGSGFSRRENLQEHLRRVHRQIGDAEADKQVAAEAVSPVLAESRRRRRRVDDDEEDGETEPVLRELRKRRRNESDNEDQSEDQNQRRGLSAEVKRLRKELQEKDERLRKLEEAVQLLMKQMA